MSTESVQSGDGAGAARKAGAGCGCVGIGIALLAVCIFVVACPGPMVLHYREVVQSEPVQTAMKRAQQNERLKEKLGEPMDASFIVTRSSDLYWRAGGTSRHTPFPLPSSKTKRIRVLTVIEGPRGEAYLSIDGEQDVKTGEWTRREASVYGGDLNESVQLLP